MYQGRGEALNRVVVTGIGALTPLGNSFETSWEMLLAGKCGIRRATKIDVSVFPCQVVGEVHDFDPAEYLDAKDVRRNDPFVHFAVAATRMAIGDAQLDMPNENPYRVGTIIGSGIGGLQTIDTQSKIIHDEGVRRVSPFMIPALIVDMASGVAAIAVGAKGPNFSCTSACSTGAHSVGDAYHFLRLGKADVMLAGGAEGGVNPFSFAGFSAMKALCTSRNEQPERASRPFDATRDGFVMGEGACVLVLETLEHAQARGARIYCEIVGYAANCDAHHITAPVLNGCNLSAAIRAALEESDIPLAAVDYINAHGTSTIYNDLCETNAYKLCFGEHAHNLAISSTKGATGHMLGAAGAFESAVCAKAIQTGIVPPTINYENPDPQCDLNYTPNKPIKRDVRVAVKDNMGFGGHNAALVFKKFEAKSVTM
ncbi:MAG: beta-ketoacyl-ACP synthase II [Puniceicoccales bacterium]|jgi:3-oxoacyl-[acyl-carrier-protein] synthase II|nr:beta-ketoacyl-ACP synthase II [Puniceicoccales bacterium]